MFVLTVADVPAGGCFRLIKAWWRWQLNDVDNDEKCATCVWCRCCTSYSRSKLRGGYWKIIKIDKFKENYSLLHKFDIFLFFLFFLFFLCFLYDFENFIIWSLHCRIHMCIVYTPKFFMGGKPTIIYMGRRLLLSTYMASVLKWIRECTS